MGPASIEGGMEAPEDLARLLAYDDNNSRVQEGR